jgi:aspartate carbamoyltransferase catalytic subunit
MASPRSSQLGRYPAGGAAFPHRHLLGIGGLAPHEILFLLDEAEQWIELNRRATKRDERLAGLTIINAFFENSTRTLLSFEIAGKRLGADVVNMHAAQSSVKKGETLIDTALTMNALPDRDFNGLRVTICGDLLHSRVARSNIQCLTALGAEVRVCAPPALMPAALETMGVTAFDDFDAALADADVVMMLRLQQERMQGQFVPSAREYRRLYGLTLDRLARAAPGAVVMHPGPMNRGIEIDSQVADLADRSLITRQVELGVAVRMACLDVLTRLRRGVPGWAAPAKGG